MIDAKNAAAIVARLGILPFFPAETAVRAEIVLLACKMCGSIDRLEWLVSRATTLWDRWHGPRELRALLCARFRPADGVEAYSGLPQYLDEGYPAETPLSLGASEPRSLPPPKESVHTYLAEARKNRR